MKIVYITLLLFLSSVIYAQENKQAAPTEDQAQVLKQAKEQEAKTVKDNQEKTEKKTSSTALVSDQGLEVRGRRRDG